MGGVMGSLLSGRGKPALRIEDALSVLAPFPFRPDVAVQRDQLDMKFYGQFVNRDAAALHGGLGEDTAGYAAAHIRRWRPSAEPDRFRYPRRQFGI